VQIAISDNGRSRRYRQKGNRDFPQKAFLSFEILHIPQLVRDIKTTKLEGPGVMEPNQAWAGVLVSKAMNFADGVPCSHAACGAAPALSGRHPKGTLEEIFRNLHLSWQAAGQDTGSSVENIFG
jgi:hypothetical protein